MCADMIRCGVPTLGLGTRLVCLGLVSGTGLADFSSTTCDAISGLSSLTSRSAGCFDWARVLVDFPFLAGTCSFLVSASFADSSSLDLSSSSSSIFRDFGAAVRFLGEVFFTGEVFFAKPPRACGTGLSSFSSATSLVLSTSLLFFSAAVPFFEAVF